MELDTDKFIINPIVTWQLGLTETEDAVALINIIGEDGREVTLLFPYPDYLREVGGLLVNAADMLQNADENGWHEASTMVNEMADDPMPDDLSALEDIPLLFEED